MRNTVAWIFIEYDKSNIGVFYRLCNSGTAKNNNYLSLHAKYESSYGKEREPAERNAYDLDVSDDGKNKPKWKQIPIFPDIHVTRLLPVPIMGSH